MLGHGFIGVLFLFFIFSVKSFFYEFYTMGSVSMYPAMDTDSIMFVKKYRHDDNELFGIFLDKTPVANSVKRGDVIVFKYPKDPKDAKAEYVKRVIGMPGDKIVYKNRTLIINGKKLTLKKLYDNKTYEVYEENIENQVYKIAHLKNKKSHNREFIFRVPEEQYFVFGDNRDRSNDSRFWGGVPKSNITGSVVYVF